jgi:hypothetical protein
MVTQRTMDDILNATIEPTRQYVDAVFVEKTMGVRRPRLYKLTKAYPDQIKSIRLTMPGKTRGKRLWHLPSLVQFIKDTQVQEDAKQA